MADEPKQRGLFQAGEVPLIKRLVKETAPVTRAQHRLLDTAVTIQQQPDEFELAFMARELVQCTLPHSNPGDVPVWTRTNGNLTLVIVRTAYDQKAQKLLGFPYGSIPRLLLFWMTTEALRTTSRRLELGGSYAGFLREIGLDPATGGGKRSDAKRVQDQTRRLFGASIGFQQTVSMNGREGERRLNMQVAAQSELWWDPKSPDQIGLWGSWVELGEKFYQAITAAPVPVDLRALRALKRSPLALDLYAWATHKALSVYRKGKPQYVSWIGLMNQFGADYTDPKNFRKKATAALRKIQTVYPALKLADVKGGLQILPSSRPAIPMVPARRSPSR